MVRAFACYQSQRSLGSYGGRSSLEVGSKTEVDCKSLTKWRNITLAVLRCTTNATDRQTDRQKSGKALKRVRPRVSAHLRKRLSTITEYNRKRSGSPCHTVVRFASCDAETLERSLRTERRKTWAPVERRPDDSININAKLPDICTTSGRKFKRYAPNGRAFFTAANGSFEANDMRESRLDLRMIFSLPEISVFYTRLQICRCAWKLVGKRPRPSSTTSRRARTRQTKSNRKYSHTFVQIIWQKCLISSTCIFRKCMFSGIRSVFGAHERRFTIVSQTKLFSPALTALRPSPPSLDPSTKADRIKKEVNSTINSNRSYIPSTGDRIFFQQTRPVITILPLIVITIAWLRRVLSI